MSKKNIILTVAGLVVVALLAGVYFILSNDSTPQQDVTEKTETNSRRPLLPDVTEENLSSLTVLKEGIKQYRIYRHSATGDLLLEGFEAQAYANTFTSAINAACGIVVMEDVTDPLADYEYGINGEKSPYTVKISTASGANHVLYIGDKLVAGNGYYCKVAGDDNIYGIISTTNKLFTSDYSLLSKVLAMPLESSKYHYTEKFSLYKDMREFVSVEFVPEDQREEGDAFGAYTMTCPMGYVPSDINYDTVLRSLISPAADSVVTTEITPENLEKYGFTKPTYEIYYTLDGLERAIFFGNRTDDGFIYVLSRDFGFIGLASVSSHFEFLDWDIVKFINPALFGMNIDYISRISVSGKGFADIYKLSGKGTELVVTNEKTGETVDTHNFRQFYRVILMTNMEGYAETQPTDDWMLTFKIETNAGKIYEYKFYRMTTRKCYYTFNGNGEFYVSIDNVNKLISDADKLAKGIKINADAQT